jgi:hypothetical protein
LSKRPKQAAAGRTAEPDAPLRFTFVTTRAERNRASFYYPPQRTPIHSFTSVQALLVADTKVDFQRH